MPLDLLYFSGGPRERILEALLRAGHRVERVYVNNPTRWPKVAPTIALARLRNIEVKTIVGKSGLLDLASDVAGKICISAGFNYLFPRQVIERAGCFLNVHGSLLPKYPGARTLPWIIENGETESGVTVHLVDDGMDTGPVLVQKPFALSPFETTRSLARKLRDLEPKVVLEALRVYERDGISRVSPQTEHSLPHLANRVPEHSKLDPTRPLTELFNKIRAADPEEYPAYFFYHGEKVCVRLWRPNRSPLEDDLI
jgi:methionyl-tRNA formyltransferase